MGRCKKEHGIEVLIPLKKNMDVYEDVLGLVRNGKVQFSPYTPRRRSRRSMPSPLLFRGRSVGARRSGRRRWKRKKLPCPLRPQRGSWSAVRSAA
jgi:hypothetical protein